MATRNTDINLIVRAKTEGDKAIASLAEAVNHLVNDAGSGNREFAEFGRTVAALDKAAAGLATAQDKVGASATKQAQAIHTAADGIRDQQARVDTLTRGLALLSREAEKAFVGPRRNGLADLIRVGKSELADAERQLGRYTAAYDRNLASLQTTRSGLLDLRRSIADTADAQASATAASELNAKALNEQAAATQRVAAAQQFFNNKGAPTIVRGAATDNGAGYGALLENFQRLEAEAAKVREAVDPLSVAIERYEQRIANLRGAALNGLISGQDAVERERQLHVELQKTLDAIGHVSAAEQDRIRKGLDGLRELSRAEQAQANQLGDRALNIDQALERSTGVGKLPATSQGATYSELSKLVDQEAAEETEKLAQAKRSAAVAFEQFEARVRSGALAMQEAEAAEARDQATIAQLQAKIDPLGVVQARLNAELERYRSLLAEGKISAESFAKAQEHIASESEQAALAIARTGHAGGVAAKPNQQIGLFGLKPYELQNLSYQINDVVTGLASGQRATQVIAQQGGQILQLFPKVTGNIFGAIKDPRIALLVVTVGALAAGLKEAADQSQRLREFTSETTFRSDGGEYDPKKLSDAAEALERMGAKADDAKAAVKTLLDEGLNPALLDTFARAAEQTAQRLGEDLPAAAKQLADAFSGGYDAVAQLDNKLNFLTASEREHIRALFEEGNANAARSEALNAYTRQSEAAAEKQRGPWGAAALSLGRAWKSLIDYISDSAPVKITVAILDELAGAVKGVGDAITSATGGGTTASGAAAAQQKIAQAQAQVKQLQADIADLEAKAAKNPKIAGTFEALIAQSKRQLAIAQAELAKAEKSAPDTLSDDPNGVAAKERSDELQRIGREDELQRLRDAGRVRQLTAQEKARREELAGLDAARGASDAVVAAAEKRRAVAHETAQIEKESDERAKAAAAERERSIKQFETRVIGAEGGAGQNPFSSAKGFGQFTNGTFLEQFAKVFPAEARRFGGGVAPSRASDAGAAQILALRQSEPIAKAIIDNYARENARLLEGFGQKITAGNLYLAHFLGANTAAAVLRANGDTPVNQIINRADPRHAAAVLSGNQGYLRTEGGKGRYRTASELQAFIANRVGDTGSAQSEGQAALNNLLVEGKRKQDEFNLAVEHGIQDKQDALRYQRQENGLYGTALIAAQREKAITDAEREERQKAEDANKNLKPGETPVVVSQDQIDKAKELAGALFDAQHAKEMLSARLADAQRPVDELTEQRDLLIQQRDLLLSMGETKGAAALTVQIDGLRDKIGEAYDKLIAFYKALSPEQRTELGIVDQAQLDNLIAKLELAKGAARGLPDLLGGAVSGKEFLSAFSGSAATAFENFIKNVAAGKNVFKSFAEGVREFVASFALSLAEAILKTLAFALALKALAAITGIPVQALAAAATVGASVHHTGGVVGQPGRSRQVSPVLFAGAKRFHTGGIPGLGPDEVPIIAKKGEEVLTENDPRHRNNGGLSAAGGASQPGTNVYFVADPDQLSELILRSPAGTKHQIANIADNATAVKAALAQG